MVKPISNFTLPGRPVAAVGKEEVSPEPVAWQVQRIDPEEGPSIWRDADAELVQYCRKYPNTWNVRELYLSASTYSESEVVERVRALLLDDGYACSFQSMGQYRTALLKTLTHINIKDTNLKGGE